VLGPRRSYPSFRLIGSHIIPGLGCNVDSTRPVQSIEGDGALPSLPCCVLCDQHYGVEGGQRHRHGALHGVCCPASYFELQPNLHCLQDEPFHVPQAQAYCKGEWTTWDPKITTPPGLYVSSGSHVAVILTYTPQVRVERHPEASHYLQMHITCTAVNPTVDFTGAPICSDAFTLLP
jgi:hypothetical protein